MSTISGQPMFLNKLDLTPCYASCVLSSYFLGPRSIPYFARDLAEA